MTVINRTVEVAAPPEVAFEVFTDGIGRWWPLEEFSYGRNRANNIYLEARVGGRFYERFIDGDEMQIGVVVACDPPACVVFTWRAPGWDAPTEVHVTFTPTDTGTRVEISHRGFDQIGPDGKAMSQAFGGGWSRILGAYAVTV